MRLHRLVVSAFGPFADRVEVDLDTLGDAGIFLIHGPTGAGKTSLLDAICFALYAAPPGLRPGGRSLRSDHADRAAIPRVDLELTVGGRRLRVVRSPEFMRAKLRGTGETKVPASVTVHERVGGSWVVRATRLDEAGLLLKDALGMGLEQFSRVVLLPQGDFAAFLRATPEARRDLLERLFDVTRYTDIESWLAAARRDGANGVEAARTELAGQLARADDVLAKVPSEVVGDLPAWSALAGPDLGSALRAVDERVHAHAATSLALRDEAEHVAMRATQALHDGQTQQADLERGRSATAVLAELDASSALLAQAAQQVTLAERAGRVGGDLRAWDSARDTRAAAEQRCRIHLEAAQALGLTLSDSDSEGLMQVLADGDADLAEATRAEVAALEYARRADAFAVTAEQTGRHAAALAERSTLVVARHTAASAERDRLAGLAAALPRLQAQAAELERIASVRSAYDAVRVQVGAARAAEAQARAAASTSWATVRATLQARLDGMAAELADRLVDGAPCPVCGSLAHPEAAQAERVVTAADVAAAEAESEAHRRRAERAAAALAGLEELERARRDDLGEDTRDLPTLSVALDAARGQVTQAAAADRSLTGAADLVTGLVQQARTIETQRLDALREAAAAAAHASELQRAAATLWSRIDALITRHEAHCPCVTRSADGSALGEVTAADVAARHTQVSASVRAVAAARGELALAAHATNIAEQTLKTVLDAEGFASAEAAREANLDADALARLRRLLADANERRISAKATLADARVAQAALAPAPDVGALAEVAVGAAQAHSRAHRSHTVAEEAARDLTRIRQDVVQSATTLASTVERQHVLARLADTTGGLGPDNLLRMRLSSFVLAGRLEHVVALANERLSRLGDGRFLLEHSDQVAAGGRRSGLGLVVHDLWTGLVRDTATLSGGESFMASLALALGLADAVREQSGGIDLQTLFIDEGFGTLDEESLEQVMAVLDDLRDGGRAVGVVSHVSDLRSRIPTQLRVDKASVGSTVSLISATA
jgi:exonuclease SbcC